MGTVTEAIVGRQHASARRGWQRRLDATAHLVAASTSAHVAAVGSVHRHLRVRTRQIGSVDIY